ncbi:hypothetical protein GQX73_g6517 [Xylaria multiplex]|uniref:Uncharacterized protein n=1 Tax=Xylaria multiplex TaxID=323545 RepID=A0A7C8IMJ8_9PEZI|nr:hypothetical protein GQX73_g6517 [Xylaria multiplex]
MLPVCVSVMSVPHYDLRLLETVQEVLEGSNRRTTVSTGMMSAQGYADAVSAYARNSIGSTLYPGPNYERLAAYLQQSSSETESHQPIQNGGPRTKNAGCLNPPNSSAFAHLYRGLGFDENRRIEVMSPYQLSEELGTHNNLKGEAAGLLFLNGQPSARWLATIGATLRVDPEYFQRHLEFFSTAGRTNYFPLPTLPSSSKYIINLRYFTIGRPGPNNMKPSLSETNLKRSTSIKDMEAYIASLTSTITQNKEQEILYWCSLDWVKGIVWSDSGHDLGRGPQGPWSRYMQENSAGYPNPPIFLPTIQSRPWAALKTRHDTITPGANFETEAPQSARILHLEYGKTLDKQLIKQDPFYAFAEIFRFCAFSNVQFLNLIESNLSSDLTFSNQETWAEGQADIIYMQQILEAHMERLRENISVIKARGGSSWPQPGDTTLLQKSRCSSQSLENDYEYLLRRATRLAERCRSKTDKLTAKAMLAESSKAIEQATEITKLTRLTFFFIPLSFTTSFFGMNLSPLSEPNQPLWRRPK